MIIKTSELIGPALDWAVAKCLGVHPVYLIGKNFLSHQDQCNMCYSFDWSQGGTIIELKGISCILQSESEPRRWVSEYSLGCARSDHGRSWGPTALIAAMRCYCLAQLGDEVKIPKELAELKNAS